MRAAALLLGYAVWLLASVASAADGDRVTATEVRGGDYEILISYFLCDGDTTAVTCAQFDFGKKNHGITDIIILERAENNGCTANATATFSTASGASSDGHDLGSTTAVDDATTRLVFHPAGEVFQRYLNTTLTNMTGCSGDGVDVLIHFAREVER